MRRKAFSWCAYFAAYHRKTSPAATYKDKPGQESAGIEFNDTVLTGRRRTRRNGLVIPSFLRALCSERSIRSDSRLLDDPIVGISVRRRADVLSTVLTLESS